MNIVSFVDVIVTFFLSNGKEHEENKVSERRHWDDWSFAGSSCCRMKDCRSYGTDIMGHRVVKVKASTMSVSAEIRVTGGARLEHKNRLSFYTFFSGYSGSFSKVWWYLYSNKNDPSFFRGTFSPSFSTGFIILMTLLQDLEMDTLITVKLSKWALFLTCLSWYHW